MKIVKFINFYYRLLHLVNFDSHRNFRKKLILQNSSKKDSRYDYGEGMFYQSMPPIKLNGLRDTKKRIKKLRLDYYLQDKTVLDIGTNIGAIPLSVKKNFKEFVGIDHNSDVIDIANKVRDYLNIENIKFICGDFMKHNFEKKFDLDLKKSYVVGDRWRDIDAGFAANCKTIFIDKNYDEKLNHEPDFRVKNLKQILRYIK